MQRFDGSLSQYILDHTSKPDELFLEIERKTHLKVLRPQMVSGILQGKVLEMISCMIKPSVILELGTYTGYSALCLAKGLKPNGKIITIDNNDELEDLTQSFFNKSIYKDRIEFNIGDAKQIIPKLTDVFDLVFIDADKREYPDYYNMIIDKVASGGFIVADDVLWYGKVNGEVSDNDKYTIGLQKFNEMVQNDVRVENVIFPIRDGLMIIRKL